MPEGLSPQEVGKEIAEHAEHGGDQQSRGAQGPADLDHRGRSTVDRRSAGGLVRLRGGEVEHGVTRGPRQGRGREDQGEPGGPQGQQHPEFRLLDLRSVVRRLHRRQSAGDGPRRAPLPPRIPRSRSTPGARRTPRRTPTRRGGRPTCRNTASRASGGQSRSTRRRTRLSPTARDAGETSDKYIRTTVFLASVLFLVGISTRFPLPGRRYALVGLGAVMLVISFVQLMQLPGPPT